MRKIITFLVLFIFLSGGVLSVSAKDAYVGKRHQMVQSQIAARGVADEKVLDALLKVKRHVFVPNKMKRFAYEDRPLPIGLDQTISQPYIVAFMTEAAQLKPDDKVLEIGTGSGYQAAVLGEIVGEVYTIEILEPLAKRSKKLLKSLGYKNIFVRHGDGYKGWPEQAPFDVIIVTAAPAHVPTELVKQLKVGGRMVIPIGSFYQSLYRITKTERGVHKDRLMPVRFVPMIRGKK